MKSIVLVVTVALGACCMCGCCTQYVHNIGKTESELKTKRILSNEAGDIVVQAELVRHRLNNRDASVSLGTRYVYLLGNDARQEISDIIRRGHVVRQRGTNYMQLSKSNFNAEYVGRWQFQPPDVLNRLEIPPLPSAIGQPLTEYAGRRWDGRNWTDSELHYAIDGTNYVVEVCIGASGIWFPEAYHQATWGYPLKILFVPAVVLDVVTFPIQFIWFVNEMGKWGDGSGVH